MMIRWGYDKVLWYFDDLGWLGYLVIYKGRGGSLGYMQARVTYGDVYSVVVPPPP